MKTIFTNKFLSKFYLLLVNVSNNRSVSLMDSFSSLSFAGLSLKLFLLSIKLIFGQNFLLSSLIIFFEITFLAHSIGVMWKVSVNASICLLSLLLVTFKKVAGLAHSFLKDFFVLNLAKVTTFTIFQY